MEFVVIIASAALVNNFVLARFLGICPYLGVSKKIDTAVGMTMAVTFVMTLASVITWVIEHFVLLRFDLGYLRTVAFILVVASLVQLTEMFVQKMSPTLYQALGIFLPLITTNCAVLGVALLCVQSDYDLLRTAVFALGAAGGFGLALIMFAGLRERLDRAEVPKPLRGVPIALVTAGLLSLAFMGFAGLVQ
jgi:electron transport complex protein RnfA